MESRTTRETVAPTSRPVLLLGFNRPEKARRVLAAIRDARPPRLYLAVDGPRADRPEDRSKTRAVCRLVEEVDWDCDVRTRFLEENQGRRRAVSGAIDWFFEHEAAGVVLEDDVVPEPEFFRFCDELLETYADVEEVGSISGVNPLSCQSAEAGSYRFSRYPHVWGWASWRRAWAHYDDCADARAHALTLRHHYGIFAANLLRHALPLGRRSAEQRQ